MDPKSDPTPFLRGLYHLLSPERIAHIPESSGRQSIRARRIPASAATRLVVALGLFADLSIPQVWRRLHPATDAPAPVESAFAQARARLGVRPLRELFDAVPRPMTTHQTIGASYRGWRPGLLRD
ncbi:transposase domain-containing protein [Gemmata sp. JC717]|uniref:transposase domain-containing protein n=1 Tax=Gemmata algarum TaxID=2975278 RepID=UPI0021BA3F4F|nr:transposase domain-containing protein [Gemmata algarum]MDY3556343.1 transposase domain-containing protein [Gemmata algarum]